MKTLVNVKNWVTVNPILPGIAESGTMKLMNDIITIEKQGK